MRRVTRNRLLGAGATLLIGLGALRIALPDIIRHRIDARLDAIEGYTGHVDDVDLWLIRGAYAIDGLVIEKEGNEAPVPFVDVARTDLSVQWKSLLHGSFVGEIEMYHPKLNFTNGNSEAEDQAGTGADWRATVREMFPLRINRLGVYDGEIHYADFTSSPSFDLDLRNIQAEAHNLTNSEDLGGTLVATVDATGSPLGLGQFWMHADVDPYTEEPTFDLDMEVKDVPLTGLNPFLNAYGAFDAEAGKAELYTEVACKEGALSGYVKPVLLDARMFVLEEETKEDREGPLRVAWEAVVGLARPLLENPKKDDIAAKVPIHGTLADVDTDPWQAAFSLVGNAYVKALLRRIDYDVSLGSQPKGDARREDRASRREQRRAERKSRDEE
jgi:hypothetical protein